MRNAVQAFRADSIRGLAGEAARFATVGLGATILHVTAALLFHRWLGLGALNANLAGFAIAFAFSYAGHVGWTFGSARADTRSLARFLVVSLAALTLGQTLVWLSVVRGGWPFAAGQALVVLAVPAATFTGAKLWAFANTDGRAAPDRNFLATLAAIAGLFAATIALRHGFSLNHDVAWLLGGAERLLDGSAFGRDVDDVTPPWAWWLQVPVVALSRATGLSFASSSLASTVVVLAGALALSAPLLRRESRALWLPLLASVTLAAAGYDFAQREHIMLIAVLPYILSVACRMERVPMATAHAVAIGFMAAAGLLQKPPFLAVPLALEIMLWWHLRRFPLLRPETIAMVALGVVYLVLAPLAAPDWFSHTLPRMLASYGAYGNDWQAVAMVVAQAALVPGLVVAAAALLSARASPHAKAFAVAGLGVAVAAIAQSKGWAYHLLPMRAFLTIAALFALAGLVSIPAVLRIVCGLLVVVLVARPSVDHALDRDGNEAAVVALARTLTQALGTVGACGGRPLVMGFNTSPRLVHPAVLAAGARWAGRAGNLHYVPAATAPGASARQREIGREQGLAALARMEAEPPHAIVVDDRARKLGFRARSHDWLDWFHRLAPKRFEALMSAYIERERVAGMRVFIRAGSTRGKAPLTGM